MFQENRGLLDKNRTEGYLIEKGDFMADIMETNPDNSPVCMDLHPVFHLD